MADDTKTPASSTPPAGGTKLDRGGRPVTDQGGRPVQLDSTGPAKRSDAKTGKATQVVDWTRGVAQRNARRQAKRSTGKRSAK